jgi:hypothetical protein
MPDHPLDGRGRPAPLKGVLGFVSWEASMPIGDPAARKVLQPFQEGVRIVIELLEKGQTESGARQFIETIAFGPGTWEQLPDALRQTFVFNAVTFLDEQRDPEWLMIDLQRLANFSPPALLTQGDQSESFFPLVVEK